MGSDRRTGTPHPPSVTYRRPPLVAAVQVSRTFGAGRRAVVAVHGATCTIEPDARIAISGVSGSGKSTLLHLFAGLDQPTSGSLEWPAQDHGGAPGSYDVATVFQGASLIPSLTARENAALPLVLQGIGQGIAEDRADLALTDLGVGGFGGKLPEELSGGQAQRVAVARAVATSPRLILADEPTGQLDHRAAQRVVDVLLHTADRLGAALVVSTHDPQVAHRLVTPWRMHQGRLDTHLDEPSCRRS
ncbi:MAG: ATP-binding cassette domain-containing protein [Nocardioidaceae bacterium]|nr:ATP-binding cassette domain-containing protein [Nocardioidaceae bacterium]